MFEKINWKTILLIALAVLLSVIVIFVLYSASLPKKYDLQVGERAPVDLLSSRAVINQSATHARAVAQAQQVPDIYVRSVAISEASLENLQDFFTKLDEYRVELYTVKDSAKKKINDKNNKESQSPDSQNTTEKSSEHGSENISETESTNRQSVSRRVPQPEEIASAAEKMMQYVKTTFGIEMNVNNIISHLSLSDSIYAAVKNNTKNIAEAIMQGEHDSSSLLVRITSQVNELIENNPYYNNEYAQIANILRIFLQANMVYDEQATLAAKNAAYQRIINDPILIPAGTTIVSRGQSINEEQYQILTSLSMIKSGGVNTSMLVSIILLYSIVAFVFVSYYLHHNKDIINTLKDWAVLIFLLLTVFFISTYISGFSPLLMPVYFLALIISTYFGLKTSLVVTFSLIILLFPASQLNTQFLFTASIGSLFAALIASGRNQRQNYAISIVGTASATFTASVLYSALNQSPLDIMLKTAGISALNAFLSAVLAIGVSPLLEIFLSTVSPTRLISLADANQPLLKRLFIEAPATYQHSMMVANLAEAAAETVGADTLLVRVGAYYHDIGKLWNPVMYTENQSDNVNPHSHLRTEESKRVIFNHVRLGQQFAAQYGLPEAVMDFIRQHHGTTILHYFFTQACDSAEKLGVALPNASDYQYPGPSPQSKEIAIVMLADTVEAAMKSTGLKDINEVEKLIRKLVRGKIDQNQLVESGLSFADVEDIIRAFVIVYEGQLHERVKYPDDNRIKQAEA